MKEEFSTKKVAAGRQALDEATPPNAFICTDFAYKINNSSVVHRLMIVELKSGDFQLKEFIYNLPRASQLIVKSSYRNVCSKDEAISQFNNKAIELKEFGYRVVGHKEVELARIFENGFFINRFDYASLSQYTPKSNLIYQPISGGIHCFLKINQYGEIALHEINHANEVIAERCLITPYVKCFADVLLKHEHFRGALIEGFATENNFTIIDAGYLIDKDFSNTSLAERLSALEQVIGKKHERLGVYFSSPCKISKHEAKHLGHYVIERGYDTQFSLYDACARGRKVYTSHNVLALQPVDNLNGTVHCQYIDNEDLTYDFSYLSSQTHLAMETYYVSEMANGPTLIF